MNDILYILWHNVVVNNLKKFTQKISYYEEILLLYYYGRYPVTKE